MVSSFNHANHSTLATRSTILDPDLLPSAGARWDRVTTLLLAVLLVFMPASFGAVEAWSQLVVLTLAAALSLCLVARAGLDPEFRVAMSWLYVPAGLFVLLILLQLIPLPTSIVSSIAPWSVSIRQQLLGTNFDTNGWTTLSLYPTATKEQLELVLVGVTVFVTVASVFRTAGWIKLLLTIVFSIGCAEAALALAQIVSGSTEIYWRIPVSPRVITSGSFVNYSNFAQFMNLSLGTGLALLLIRMREQHRYESSLVSWTSQVRRSWEQHRWDLAGIILCATAVCASMSRNGVISLVVAAAVVAVALYRRGAFDWQGWVIFALPIGVLAVLLVFGFDYVYDRLATLHDAKSYKTREELTAATLRAWRSAPLLGTGLGTHEYVFPMFDTSQSPVLAAHADNDYAQLLEETGAVGAVLMAAFYIGIVYLVVKLAKRGRTPLSNGVYGLALGLIAISIHSATDFGQRLPANFCVTATFCGLIVAMWQHEERHRKLHDGRVRPRRTMNVWIRRTIAGAAFAVLAVAWTAVVENAYGAYIAERWYAAAVAIDSRMHNDASSKPNDDDYIDLIAAAQAAAQSAPSNVTYRYWLNYYRWESLGRNVDPESGRILLRADALPIVRHIAEELSMARTLCPTFGPAYALEGQLRFLVLAEHAGVELVRAGVRLAPYDPPTCLVAGEMAARSGRMDEAVPLLARAVAMNREYFAEVAAFYVAELKRPDLARELAGDDYRHLTELVRLLPQDQSSTKLSQDLLAQAEASLRNRVSSAKATSDEIAALAQINLQRGDLASAIELYDRALGDEYTQVDWRLNLARALAAKGQFDDAIHQLRICLRLRPHHAEATQMLSEVSARAEDTRSKNSQ
jgi:O-antigen ligase/tetratricopeptide (TPR) repeat protein